MKLSWAHRITHSQRGFTIVELLVVVVVIGILATITVVSYNGITKAAEESVLKSNLATLEKKITVDSITNDGGYSESTIEENLYTESAGTITRYRYGTTDSYCIDSTTKNGSIFHLDTTGGNSQIKENECPALTNTFALTSCTGSVVYLRPRQINYLPETLSIGITTPHGSIGASNVSSGSSKSQTFNTRAASIERGFITITMVGINGSTFNATIYQAYEPKSCP